MKVNLPASKQPESSLRRLARRAGWRLHVWRDWAFTVLIRSRRTVRTPYGFPMVAGPFGVNRMMQDGTFEPAEIEVVRALLRAADAFVDVGANIGLYTCLARAQGKHAIAIEPQEQNLALLYANLNLNGWSDVEVFPLGVAEKSGLVELYGASGPSASLIRGWAGYSQRYRRTIAVSTLDILLANRFPEQRLVIKIDVEGAEHQVLLGAERTLGRTPKPTWIVEICRTEFHPGGSNPRFLDTFELFWRHGYEARWMRPDSPRLERREVAQWLSGESASSDIINYVFSAPR